MRSSSECPYCAPSPLPACHQTNPSLAPLACGGYRAPGRQKYGAVPASPRCGLVKAFALLDSRYRVWILRFAFYLIPFPLRAAPIATQVVLLFDRVAPDEMPLASQRSRQPQARPALNLRSRLAPSVPLLQRRRLTLAPRLCGCAESLPRALVRCRASCGGMGGDITGTGVCCALCCATLSLTS
jgi:hypothetical protein